VGPVLPALALPTHSADVCRRRPPSDRNSPLRIHGIHSFANFTLATANHLGRKGAFELRSLIRKRNQTNQLQTKLPTSGPGGRRFKSSLPDQSFSRTYNHSWICQGAEGLQKGLHWPRRLRRGHEFPPNSRGSHAHGFNSFFPPRLVVDILGHIDSRMSHVVSRHFRPNSHTAHWSQASVTVSPLRFQIKITPLENR